MGWGGVTEASSSADQSSYRQALPGYRWSFPRDHASHPQFRTEWWYFTGHLKTRDQRTFGYELTFFRTEVGAKPLAGGGDSRWRLQRVFPAHFALTDEKGRRFRVSEKLTRDTHPSLGLAGARTDVPWVWNESWQMVFLGDTITLQADAPWGAIQLALTPEKPPIIHGVGGISQKSDCRGCASHYVSFTRLKSQGVVLLNGQSLPVSGQSWMDHEFGSNQLSTKQVGWDWFSIQLSDGSDLMIYLLREKGGRLSPQSAGTWVNAQGGSVHLTRDQIQVKPLGTWTSPKTGGRYPARWEVSIPSQQLRVTVTPTLADQELQTQGSTGLAYWEGRSRVQGTHAGKPISGQAYVELTGYGKPFRAKI